MAHKGHREKGAQDGLVILLSITNHSIFCAVIPPMIHFVLELVIYWLIQKNNELQQQFENVPNVIESVF